MQDALVHNKIILNDRDETIRKAKLLKGYYFVR